LDILEGIKKRRAYRSLKPIIVDDNIMSTLAESAQLAPSCFNNQPSRFIFIYDRNSLKNIYETLSKGNKWAEKASLIVVVFSKRDFDCQIKDRDYYLFDIGLATGFLILRATELGLVAHPIAGYNEEKVKEILSIPNDMTVITLIIIGGKSDKIDPELSDKQIERETKRPIRLTFDKFVNRNKYGIKF
jgi:nitroreductase